ncbi:CBO0543 family protein [Paenibacillus sp.]|uniref:CBO0543 family protein n=1 Tax=Paenibacillus sp. TaxID=58172 RepID=UPI002D37CE4E|nr:CBO0543 family protein [Paenibacillus sp.]HZG58110.1 CBO0543 family protein [Paenibacillus sp.]
MEERQQNLFQALVSAQEELTKSGVEYWKMYSGPDTWQFWFIAAMLLGPLAALFFLLDRKRIFQIAFFGFATHVLFAYADAYGIRYGLWAYPYQLLPILPSVSLDAAFIPIAIMLVYQWTLKAKKNFLLYSFLTALAFGFGFKPGLVALGLFIKYKWVNYPIIFLIYLVLFWLAYGLTRWFERLHERARD